MGKPHSLVASGLSQPYRHFPSVVCMILVDEEMGAGWGGGSLVREVGVLEAGL